MVCLRLSLSSLMRFLFGLKLEVVLNGRRELLDCLLNEGILRIIGDIIVSEADPVVLVCILYFSLIIRFFFKKKSASARYRK